MKRKEMSHAGDSDDDLPRHWLACALYDRKIVLLRILYINCKKHIRLYDSKREDATYHGVRLVDIPAAEKHVMVEDVVEVVNHFALLVTLWQGPFRVIRLVKFGRIGPKELGHGNVDFAVAVVRRWVEYDWVAVAAVCLVAAPQVAVHEARHDVVLRQEGLHLLI